MLTENLTTELPSTGHNEASEEDQEYTNKLLDVLSPRP